MRKFHSFGPGFAAVLASFLLLTVSPTWGQMTKSYDSAYVEGLKKAALTAVSGKEKSVQEMVDMIFSFGELGFQEFETSKYLVGVLEKNGFTVEKGVSGIPTAWFARWGSGKPVISLGTDIDGIPKASQKPGVSYPSPMIEG